jgi:predicted ATPase
MDLAIKRHDTVIRAAIEAHRGHVFKTIGDAFCSAFERVSDAVAAAVELQRALAREDFSAVGGLRVKAGLHVGEASERHRDYFGPSLNRVARLMSISHGGQVVLSSIAHEHALPFLPDGTALTDLGLQRLRDLAGPERVWQLTIVGLRAEFPPLKSLDALPNNLPIQPTSFRGREHDLEDAKALLDQHNLLTLIGAGGIGKSRLALQVAADMLDRFDDGVWLTDFATITDPVLVSSVVARALGMAQVDGIPLDEAIPHWLKHKKLLAVFDNCERVIEAVAHLADAVIRCCPNVRILTTSRQPLGIGGEVLHRVPSLTVPSNASALRSGDALSFGAIALFVDRAKAADTRFVLGDDNAPIVADVCRRLDGIPLAIELAAARVKVLSIPNLERRLSDRFKVLTGGSRTAMPRQRTLSALIDWSYDFLAPREQLLFSRVAIFAGGFTLESTTAVCAGESIAESDILDHVSSLADKSLVVADTSGEQERYRLLESTRAYALDKLAASGEREAVALRLAEYFRDKAQAADLRYGSVALASWLASIEVEMDNYRATLEWSLTEGRDAILGGVVAGALARFWLNCELTIEGRYWIGLAQAGIEESAQPRVAASLWNALSILSDGKRKHDCAERALTLYLSLCDQHGAAWAILNLAYALFQMGRLGESSDAHSRALAAMRECGYRRGVASCLNQRASIDLIQGRIDAARDLYAQALQEYKALGDEFGKAVVLGNLADLEFADGHAEQALQLATDALTITLRGKNANLIATGYINSAAYRIALGDEDGAFQAACDGLRWAQRSNFSSRVAWALQHLALIRVLRRHAFDAARILGYVNALYESLGTKRELTEKWGFEKLMGALRESLTDAEITKLAAEGAAWPEDRAVDEALESTADRQIEQSVAAPDAHSNR